MIELEDAWDFMSTYIAPVDNTATTIFADLGEDILMVKDEGGLIYSPEYSFDGITGGIAIGKGFQVKSIGAQTVKITGYRVSETHEFELHGGWGMLGYLPYAPTNAVDAMDSVVS